MARTGMILLPGARARTVAMRREGCGDDDSVAEDDGVAEDDVGGAGVVPRSGGVSVGSAPGVVRVARKVKRARSRTTLRGSRECPGRRARREEGEEGSRSYQRRMIALRKMMA